MIELRCGTRALVTLQLETKEDYFVVTVTAQGKDNTTITVTEEPFGTRNVALARYNVLRDLWGFY